MVLQSASRWFGDGNGGRVMVPRYGEETEICGDYREIRNTGAPAAEKKDR
jgi:hypothetical protein